MTHSEHLQLIDVIPENMAGKRLDLVLSKIFLEHSRERLKSWIIAGNVKLDTKVIKNNRYKVAGSENILIDANIEIVSNWEAEYIPLKIIYEDEHIFVIDKPKQLVVHPAVGNRTGTLVNGLLYIEPNLINIPRAGIVHRLDKDTTGLMVVARTLTAHTILVKQLQDKTVCRKYEALVLGEVIAGRTINAPIGRDPNQRIKMAINKNGRKAITHFRVKERFNGYTLLSINLETGRTHQIRVHLSSINLPIVGDKTYGRANSKVAKGSSIELRTSINDFKRQALHATELTIKHPYSGNQLTWESKLPTDFENLLLILRTAT